MTTDRDKPDKDEPDKDKRPLTAAMAGKQKSAEGHAEYRRLNAIVAPPNVWIKQSPGFLQSSLRGADKARTEFKLACAALNLRRMAGLRA